MKRDVVVLCFVLFVYSVVTAQNPGEWVWIHGDSGCCASGVYGVKGVSSPNNKPPPLYEPGEWTDLQGNFWFYGGTYPTNDLWKYNPNINEWTWMKGTQAYNDSGYYGIPGVPSPLNQPSSRGWGITTWTDLKNNLWMFGGQIGVAGQGYNDLWKYDINTNQWIWMKGSRYPNQSGVYGVQGVPDSSNNPRSRWECAASWVDDAGDLWLFGGYTRAPSGSTFFKVLNDLWRYNITTNTWTWMKGSNSVNQVGIYGIQGIENSLNTPGARQAYARWKDNCNNFWLFGGGYIDDDIHFNDLWRYNPSTNNWTWMGGSNTPNNDGNYGDKCVASPLNIPGQRYENRAVWIDRNGNFWMFGGTIGGNGKTVWNDLWKYCLTTNQWIWISGDSIYNPIGNWGTQGISSPTNKPSGRFGAVAWTDNKDHLYFWGGKNEQLNSNCSDLWMYTIDTTCGVCPLNTMKIDFITSDTIFCSEPAKCINFFDKSSLCNITSWQWLFPGASTDTSTQQNPTNICYTNPGTYPVTLIVSNAAGSDTLTVSPMITVGDAPAAPVVTKVGLDTLVCSHAASYQWYFNGNIIAGATDSFYVASQWGTYAVRITDSIGCSRLSDGVTVGVEELGVYGLQFMVYPNPVDETLVISHPSLGQNTAMEIYNVLGEKIYSKPLNSKQETVNCKQFSSGVYFVIVADKERRFVGKFVKE